MKMTTIVWARMESPGRPAGTKQMQGTVSQIILAYAKWMSEVYMGSHIRLTLARTESELVAAVSRKPTNAPDIDMMGELELLLGSEGASGCVADSPAEIQLELRPPARGKEED